jgi:hypothetical protein
MDDIDEGLSDEESAPLLGVKPSTLPTWRSLGRGPRYRKGHPRPYTRELIAEYLASITVKPEPASVRRQRAALSKQFKT